MKKLTAIVSLFITIGLFQGLASAEPKTNFTPKNKHTAASVPAPAPVAETPAVVETVVTPVVEVVAPVAEATGQVVEGVAAPVVGAVDAVTPPYTESN